MGRGDCRLDARALHGRRGVSLRADLDKLVTDVLAPRARAADGARRRRALRARQPDGAVGRHQEKVRRIANRARPDRLPGQPLTSCPARVAALPAQLDRQHDSSCSRARLSTDGRSLLRLVVLRPCRRCSDRSAARVSDLVPRSAASRARASPSRRPSAWSAGPAAARPLAAASPAAGAGGAGCDGRVAGVLFWRGG